MFPIVKWSDYTELLHIESPASRATIGEFGASISGFGFYQKTKKKLVVSGFISGFLIGNERLRTVNCVSLPQTLSEQGLSKNESEYTNDILLCRPKFSARLPRNLSGGGFRMERLIKNASYKLSVTKVCPEERYYEVWISPGQDYGFPLSITSAWTGAHRHWLNECLAVRGCEHLLEAIEKVLREIYYQKFPYRGETK